MHRYRTARALPRMGVAFGAALTLMAVTGDPARAAGSSLFGEGLHIASGAVVDPNGRTWVADHNGGFCRMTPAGDDGPGRIEHPQVPGGAGPRTCLGGLLPDAGPGPDAAGQPVLVDPSPRSGDEMALIPDGASPSSDVVRAKWNPHTGLFEYFDVVVMNADRGRPTSLSLGPDGAVYVGFQRETTIQRITAPASDFPVVDVVGSTSDGTGAQSIAAGRDADGDPVVYASQASGLAVLEPGTRATTTSPARFPLPAGTAIGSMHYDLGADKLYLGTANAAGPGADTLVRIDPRTNGVVADHATGFSMVGGIAQRPDGHLFVLDDPALLDPAEPMGTGRLFHVGLPAAHVTAGPLDDDGNTGREQHTRDTTPSFTLRGDGALECRLRGPGIDPAWSACATDHTVASPLRDGEHVLSVRATDDAGTQGLPEAYRFTVDTTRPLRPVVTGPQDNATVSGSPWFTFAVEDNAALTCSFDGEAATSCRPGRTRSFTDAPGPHTLQITQTDRAGNVSDISMVTNFTVDLDFKPVAAPGWGAGPPSHRGSSLYTEGLHISAGALVDPDGRTWVADHNGGFCRVTPPTEDGPGVIDHPSVPGGAGPRTCLGGLLPEAGTGPDAAGQPALFDPTPDAPGSGDEMALIPDGASPSSDVVRARWNPDSGLFEFHDVVTMIGARTRPLAVAAGPDNAAYVVFQRSGTVQRIGSPAGAEPIVDVVGNTASGVAGAVAAVRNADGQLVVYVGEGTVLTRLTPNAGRPPTAQPAPVALGAGAAAGISALAADHTRGHLYIGTAGGLAANVDGVHRMNTATNAVELDWVDGYTMIGGLALRPDGVLFVLDDPALLDPAEPLGTGRMFHVGLPAAHLGAAPAYVSVDRPELPLTGEEQIECRLRGGPEAMDTDWQDCAAGTFQPASALADGRYRLTVRAVAGTADAPIVGLVEAHSFTVDTHAPERPHIVSPLDAATVNATPWFEFDAEAGAQFECRWDGSAAWVSCFAGHTRTFTQNGDHTLRIRAIDAAGNVSEESEERSFHARGKVESVRIDSGPQGSSQSPDARFAFSTEAQDVEFACRLDNAAFTSCTSEKAYTGLPEGNHVFEVRARDAVGNVSPAASRAFRVDRTKPVLSANGFTSGAITGPDVTFDLSLSEEASLACTLDGAPLVPCGSRIVLSGLAGGEHTLTVVATDAAGNVSARLVRRFLVQVAPQAPAPESPVTVIDQISGRPSAIRISGLNRRVDLAKLRRAGVAVQVVAGEGTKLVRLRIFKLPGRRLVTTVYRRIAPGRNTITLTRRELRAVGAGRYGLEVTPGSSRYALGKPQTVQFRVAR